MRRFLIVGAVAACAGLGLTVGATTALAHSSVATTTIEHIGVVKRADTATYRLPTQTSVPVHVGLQSGTKVLVTCWTEGEKVNGSPRWWRIAVNGKVGFAPVDTVQAQPGVPVC